MKKRVFIERRENFDIERFELLHELADNFNIHFSNLRLLFGYDCFDISEETFDQALTTVFSEPNKDLIVEQPTIEHTLSIEFLPGQFDQRADSAVQSIKLINPHEQPTIYSFQTICFNEKVDEKTLEDIKKYLINQVEAREKDLTLLEKNSIDKPQVDGLIEGFIDNEKLEDLYEDLSLAMSLDDLYYIQSYFKNEEKRNPYLTEIKVLDTYWSDHCRHTTFETHLKDIVFSKDDLSLGIQEAYNDYINTRHKLNRTNKPQTLMDLATINARLERAQGNLNDLEVSEEVNAASIMIDVKTSKGMEKWLLMFKNETHNHPTEIEPFGGASTCIGGAIRDPLSGRSYVYQAMRITGAGDITRPIKDTLVGKLPQKIISKKAAHGYSSYGNQIGLATSYVNEIFHEGYIAKRMEVGVVVAAAKQAHVKRLSPIPGDIIILLGGQTGRDGIGGATGSSKSHNKKSLVTSFSEVQKGNAPEERKIQRLFRNPKVSTLIKKSNDFGAGGVSVAIGELAAGLLIDLDRVPVKYLGINGTELAISESQERMAVVVDPQNVDLFISYCHEENIRAVAVAEVTKEERLKMTWQGQIICDIDRAFIDTSGVRQSTNVKFKPIEKTYPKSSLKETNKDLKRHLKDLNVSDMKGMVEMFDATIGKTTVLAPYGGKYQKTKSQASIHRIPVLDQDTTTGSALAYGFNPYLSSWSPYHGSSFAIVEAISKIVASGGDYQNIRFSFQEYFERMSDETKWSKPLASLLGAYKTLKAFHLAAIGGKDSMSGSYHDIHVPPTLIAFAVSPMDIERVISPEFKKAGNHLYLFKHDLNERYGINVEQLKKNFKMILDLNQKHNIKSAVALTYGGLSEALIKSTFGNGIGVDVKTNENIYDFSYGSIVIETAMKINHAEAIYLGQTTDDGLIKINQLHVSVDEAYGWNHETFESVYPTYHEDDRDLQDKLISMEKTSFHYPKDVKEVEVLLPVFPGTNCEYDSASSFELAGAHTNIFVFNNLTETDIEQSIDRFVEYINESHILMLSGGFSSGDEPDGSGKFIANVLRNEKVKNAIHQFLKDKKLMIGICNGFQALVKSGLLPYGEIRALNEDDPILFKNTINRHISKLVTTKVSTVRSPWLSSFDLNQQHMIPISHGEGKFVVSQKMYETLKDNHQIAFQYVDEQGQATYDPVYNPNGSSYAIEGIVSKDGLILGKMGHSERYTENLYQNIPNIKTQDIFKNAVAYFKKEANHE